MSISTSFLIKTLNLERTVIKSVNPTVHKVRLAGEEQEQNCIEVDVQIDSPWEHKCPHCMKDCNVYDHQSGEVFWRSLGINGTPVFHAQSMVLCGNISLGPMVEVGLQLTLTMTLHG